MGKRQPIRARPDAERRLRQSDRLARVLRVLQLIQARGRHNSKEIAAELECSERTVYRDLQVLSMAGIPYYFSESENCYRVRPGWHFPALNLTPEEAIGQAVATAASRVRGLDADQGARSTTSKLAASAPEEIARVLHDAEQLITVLDLKLADHSRHREIIKTIQWGLINRKQLSGHYLSPYQEGPVKLTLHPFRLCLIHQAWYLIARPADRDRPKTYRVQRFKSLRLLDSQAEIPDAFDLEAYLGNAWSVYRGAQTYDIALQFTNEAAPIVKETLWHATQQVQDRPGGSVIMSFRVDGLEEILWWVLGWSGRVKVIRPDELRELMLSQLRRAMEINIGSGGESV